MLPGSFVSPSVATEGIVSRCLRRRLTFVVTAALSWFAPAISAAPLELSESPGGSQLYQSLVQDAFNGVGAAQADEWTFEGELGDIVSARVEAAVGNSRPRLRLTNTAGTDLQSFNGGTDGVASFDAYRITTPGTYRIRVYTEHQVGDYALRLELARGLDLEKENNDLYTQANVLTPRPGAGAFGFAAGGLLPALDAGDTYALGQAPPGSSLQVSVALANSSLTANDLHLQVLERRTNDGGLDFNGSTYAVIPHNDVFDSIETNLALTIEAWIYIRSWTQGYFSVFDKYQASGDWGWVFSIQNGSGGMSFWSASNARISSNVTPALNTWHHVALAYDHAANEVRFYLNGALVATRTSTVPLVDTKTDGAYIGYGRSGSPDTYNNGIVSELRLWNRALTSDEIAASMAAVSPAAGISGLVGRWSFDERTGTVAADSSGFGNHAVLGGGDPARVPSWSSESVRATAHAQGTSLSHTFGDATDAWIRVHASDHQGISARYLLEGALSDDSHLQVTGTSLAPAGGVTSDLINAFSITFDDELNADSANDLTNYELTGAGPDGVFGTFDDLTYTFSDPGYVNGRTVTLTITNGPLQPGDNRLRIGLGLRDRAGNTLASTYTLPFRCEHLGVYRTENQQNNTSATATVIDPLVADSDGFIIGARGSLSPTGDTDHYRFTANAGDRGLLYVHTPGVSSAASLRYRVVGPNSDLVNFVAASTGIGQAGFIVPTTGTYTLVVSYNNTFLGEYRALISLQPHVSQLEVEPNNIRTNAQSFTWTNSGASRTATVSAMVATGDPADWYALGFVDSGTQISLDLSRPGSSMLVPILELLDPDGNLLISGAAGDPSLSYTLAAGQSGNLYARVRADSGAGEFSRYLLHVSLGDTLPPSIVSATLPAEGATVSNFLGLFQLTFSENLIAATVNDAARYRLTAAGPDDTFGTPDDESYSVVTATNYSTGLIASYRVADGPLQPGRYRFEATGFSDLYGNVMTDTFVRQFTIEVVDDYTLESRSNDSIATATPLSLSANGSGFIAGARGYLTAGDNDYFRFEAQSEDRIILNVYSAGSTSAVSSRYRVHNPAGQELISFTSASDGLGQREFIAPATGTYTIRVTHNHTHSEEYRIAVSIQPGTYQLESEDNNTSATADVLNWHTGPGVRTAQVGGVLNAADPSNGDWFALGHLEVGTSVALSASALPRSDVVFVLELLRGTSVVTASSPGTSTLEHLVPEGGAGTYFARIRPTSGAGPFAAYVLSLSLADTSVPTITGATLPGEGAAVPMFLGSFQLSFSEGLDPATVNDVSNYDLRSAGADGTFGTADDVVYPLALSSVYSSGLTASYRVVAGPIQPGLYRFRAYNTLRDLYGNPLAAEFVRHFSIIDEPGYVLESNNNHSFATATSLGELAPDGDGFIGRGRGYLTHKDELDYFSFTALENDRIILTSENHPAPATNTGLAFRIYGPNQNEVLAVTSNDGSGQGGFIAPQGGTYYVRVSEYHTYLGEYRFNVSVFPDEVELESESNDGSSTADQLQWTAVPGLRTARLAGVLHRNDGSDWFALGALAPGTEVTVNAIRPPSSTLVWMVDLMNGNTLVTSGVAGAASFTTTVPNNVSGNSSIRIRASSGAGLNGYYRIEIRLSDTNSPTVVADTLPEDGGVATTFIDRFTLTFSKDMDAATVNTIANYDLRCAGPDDQFDTADDVPVTLTLLSPYSSGITASLRTAHLGPLVEGRYRLTVAGLMDRSGNTLSPVHTKTFRVGAVGQFLTETEPNGTTATATPLVLQSSQPGLLGAGGRGFLYSDSDVDNWSFSLEEGDRFYIVGETVGSPINSGLAYKVLTPAGATMASLNAANTGDYSFAVLHAPAAGKYTLQVSLYHGFNGEYRFRIYVVRGDAQIESESNDTRATANGLTLATEGTQQRATVIGLARAVGDLDYFNLGELSAGRTVFLSTRQPAGSPFVPVVSLYNAAGQVLAENAGGRSGDGVAQVNLTASGPYYALVRTSGQTSGLESEYLLDVLVVPTADISYPNLQVTSLTPLPASGLMSGDPVTITFQVENLGNRDTGAITWIDRLVLSTDQVYGNADDVEVGVFPHTGPLPAGGRYTISETLPLPDGIFGSYYLIARTDHGNTVAEFVLEADNETSTDTPVTITLADYPDLVVENLTLSEPNEAGARTATWVIANRGLGLAKPGYSETVRLRNVTTGSVLSTVATPITAQLGEGDVLERQSTLTATTAGEYVVEVVVDSGEERYELNEDGHEAAEDNNLAAATFSIVRMVTLTLQAEPAEAGTVDGAGIFPVGTSRTVSATPVAPYLFSGWFEGELLQSVQPSYTTVVSADRTLTARFSLPSAQIVATVVPSGTGVVGGAGTYPVGVQVRLEANPLPGYRFDHWSEGGNNLGSESPLVFTATSNRTLQAHFAEANPTHVVTTGTIPQGLTTVTGAGTYNNGQTAVISAPESVTKDSTEFVFSRFLLNGVPISSQRSLSKTFSTQDPEAFHYVAEYTAQALNPAVTQVMTNAGARVGRTEALQITVRFDRAMSNTVRPVIELVSDDADARPSVPAGGAWTNSETYVTPAITVGPTHGGNYRVRVSGAKDLAGRTMSTTELYPFVIDVTAPALPTLTKGATTTTSVAVTWSDYVAPSDLASFRVYRSNTSFNSVAGLSPVTSVVSSARAYTFTGLSVDTDHHVAIVPVDTVGNAPAEVTSFLIRISSELPPAVNFAVSATATDAARVSWTYDASAVAGFKGFKVYRELSAFTSIEGRTPFATLGGEARNFDDAGLNRAQTYHYAVVAYNQQDASRTDVVSKPWQDPLSGRLTFDFTVTEPVLVLHQPLTIAEGATLTVPAGTTVAFAPGAGLVVEQGRLLANGTLFAPVVFTSLADVEGAAPTRGSWTGLTLADPARSSVLTHTWVKYGMGLGIVAGNHTIDTFGAAWNELAGLSLAGPVTLATETAYLVNNTTGARVEEGASLTLTGSVLKNNTVNAAIVGAGTLNAPGNWWGSANPSAIATTVSGPVAIGSPLADEPILTRGLRSADGSDTTGSVEPMLQLASLNAVGFRISEDPSFTGVLFADVPRNPLSPDLFNSTAWTSSVTLSEGAGLKTLYAQFRSPTGLLSEPVSFQLNYVTTAPVIGGLSLTDGQMLTRPITVTASATSALPLESLTLTVDGEVLATSTTGALSVRWDIRDVTPGQHQVRLAARDNAGGLATRTVHVIVSPTPPPAPGIRTPQSGTVLTTNSVTVAGEAEPFATVWIHRNGAVVSTTEADADGAFSVNAVPLLEGVNTLTAVAFDSVGTTASTAVTVAVDSGAPAPVVLLPLAYNVGEGVFVDWDLPVTGEVPVAFRVFWHHEPFTNAAEANSQTGLLTSTHATLKDLADGLHYFAVVGYDSVGNASPLSNVRSFHVDLTPPSFSIAYNRTMPVGPGELGITVTASEPLQAAPLVLMRLQGGTLLSISLSPAGGDTYSATFPVTSLSARTGVAAIGVTGTDLAGNTFTGAPAGPELIFDLTKPTGTVATSLPSPIHTATNVSLTVSLTLSELLRSGTTPSLTFSPPDGAAVPLTLAGSGLNWVGQLTLTPAMGSGNGMFLLNVEDEVGNAGTVITSGEQIELYTGDAPSPTTAPATFTVQPLAGGVIRLAWSAVEKAHSYRIYREPGASAAVPTTLVADGITALTYDDLPAADGPYRYVVAAFRLGAESGPSGVRATTSDRTPPPAPMTTEAQLGASGIQISWTPGEGEAPAKLVIYRNDVAIGSTNPAVSSFSDAPPRGVMTYRVAAADVLGNEARGPAATLELQVGAISQLTATVDPEIGTTLTWASSDSTATGFNVYRNGAKQNGTPLSSPVYTDSFDSGDQPVRYEVKAVNAAGQESVGRSVLVQPLTATLRLNPTEDDDLVSVARYFDTYKVTFTVGAAASQPVAFAEGEIVRVVAGELPVEAVFPLPELVSPDESATATVVVPAPNVAGSEQGVSITLRTEPDAGGSVVQYRFIQDFQAAQSSGLMMTLTADNPPLAGALSNFKVRVFNRGHAPIDLVLSRNGGTQPGELEMHLTNAAGVLVSTTPFEGSVPGAIINGRGDAFLRVESGDYADLPFNGVLVPEGLGGQSLTFRARFKTIYHAVGSTYERSNGPLEGTMASSATATPYYATAQTTQPQYSDDQPVVIFGQALDRATHQPVPNVKVRVGLRVRGAVLAYEVTTDATGAYEFTYTPSVGLAGEINIWASHPDVVDQLDQVTVRFYRLYTKPGRVEAVMTKNDRLDFDVTLVNPSDLTLTAPNVSFRAFRVEGGVEVDVPGLTGTARSLPGSVSPRSEPRVGLRLQATLDMPDDAQFEFTLTTAQGATTRLPGTVSFRPALAVLTTVSPSNGYAEAGVGRGQIKSVDVTVENRGLRDLTGVRLVAPANVGWMQVNLAPDANGDYPMADIPVGGSRHFTVVFAPPADTPVGFYNDFLLIRGDNTTGDYRLNLFATVTSEQKGGVQFAVTNTFGQPVPNASIWLRNPALLSEVGPFTTDVNGQLIASNLMEGDWQWKTQAAGHGATTGLVTVIPEQIVGVETELSVSMVTVKFSVVPVPFTDYYEIKIEQTFQTRTPIPNLVMSPPHRSLSVEAGWTGTLIYTLRNEGLRSIFDVSIPGTTLPTMRVTPMVSFLPELKAQQSVEIPVYFEYFGPLEGGAGNEEELRAAALELFAAARGDGDASRSMASARSAGSAAALDLGPLDDILECYKDFKYGTISFKAEGGISSVSGKPYTVGANATIDVDELLALVCDGECPDRVTGGGVVGALCGKLVSKVVSQVGKKTKVIDVICRASNIIKAVACAAAQLPSGNVQSPPPPPPNSSSGGGKLSSPGNFRERWEVIGGGCFVAGTPITLPDGTTLPIEQVQQGMQLLAAPNGRADAVAEVMFLSSDHVRELSFRALGSRSEAEGNLRLTHDHRVWVDSRGWTFAANVQVGDWLHGADGRLHEVTANHRLPGRYDVYGLHMASDNVIYAAGILTEDQCFQETPQFRVSPQTGGAR